MRLVLINPHTHAFGRSVSGALLGRKDFFKYEYFIKHFVNNKKRRVAFLIDGLRSSFSGVGLSFLFSFKIIAFFELVIWMILNRINPFGIRIYFDIESLNAQEDILFDFSRSIVDVDDQKKILLNRFNGIVIVHFTHYFKDIKKLSDYMMSISNCIVVAENDLTQNKYFKKFFSFIKNTYHLPFSYGERFVSQGDFDSRINKCLALGSITRVKNDEFINFFGDSEGLHPMRKIIFNNSTANGSEIDSLIRGFDDTSGARMVSDYDSLVVRLIKKHFPFFILEKFYPTSQINYFKFSIVDKFNQYKMFICPEESVGLPSINVFEGMACGCVFFGADDPMYTDLGMTPGVHYVAYGENSVEDLVLKIRYYQQHPDELRKISEAGSSFVRENFNQKRIANLFWGDLECILKKFSDHKKIIMPCSFKNDHQSSAL